MARREQDQVNTAKRRALPIAIDNAISNFQWKAKMGPDFVCTVCHRIAKCCPLQQVQVH